MLPKLFRKQTYEPFQQPKRPPLQSVKVDQVVPPSVAPGTAITYNPDLPTHFKQAHSWLLQTLEAIETDAMSGEFTYADRALKTFRRSLTTHLLEENVKMYTYVAKCLAHDARASGSVLAMKAEMDVAGTTAMRFANEYAQAGLSTANQQKFLADLQTVRMALADRIDWEETSLFGLYLPPDAYK